MSAGTLIVGASHAGVHLAVFLRELGYQRPVTLVGAEPHWPYQRPPLSKGFLTGGQDLPSLALRTPRVYRDLGISLLTGERVVRVTVRGAGGAAHTDSGRELPFEQLALTTGARPQRLSVPGADLDGIVYLRGVDDAIALRSRLGPGTRLVAVGGGFIGLESAAAAIGLGSAVTVIEGTERVMARSVAPVLSSFLQRTHEERGVTFHLNTVVKEFHGHHGTVSQVELADGRRLPADVVVVGVGVAARTELGEQLGLACANGIVVDEFMRTSADRVVAAGDCVAAPDPVGGTGLVRFGSVQNAVAQARTAAFTLIGNPRANGEVPWFWSDQFNVKLQMAGSATGYDAYVVRGDIAARKFSVFYYQGDKVIAIHSINCPADYLVGRTAIARRIPLPPDRVCDPDANLKELLAAG